MDRKPHGNIGKRIKLIHMGDVPDPIKPGELGTIIGIMETRNNEYLNVRWDNGRRLSLACPPDRYEILHKEQPSAK